MNKKVVFLFVLSVVALIAMLFWIGIDAIISAILSIDIFVFVFLFFLQILIIFLYTFKLSFIIYGKFTFFSFRSFKNVLYVTLVGLLANNLTPMGAAGGEPFKAYVLHKIEKLSMERSLASVIANLFVEVLPIFILTAFALFFVFQNDVPLYITFVLIVGSAIVLILFLVSFFSVIDKAMSMKVAMFFIKIFSKISFLKKASEKAKNEVHKIVSDFNTAFKKCMSKKILFFGTIISLSIWFLSFLRFYIIFLGMGYNINIAAFIVVQITVLILSFLPLLPGSILVWEASSIGLFVLFGVPKEIAAAATVLDRLLSFWLTSLFGSIASVVVAGRIGKIDKEKDKSLIYK